MLWFLHLKRKSFLLYHTLYFILHTLRFDLIMQQTITMKTDLAPKPNYQIILDNILKQIALSGAVPRLLLHACCAPCSSYVLEYLSEYFDITVFYYNPNISPESEYRYRTDELIRLVNEQPHKNPVRVVEGRYDPAEFEAVAKGRENDPEGGGRCRLCYELRLREAAKTAADGGYDFFTTTLSISPYKNAGWLNEIGAALAEEYGVAYLFSDFKKRGGYRRSIELSAEYGLYRQNFCGCVYSRREAESRR